MSKQSAKFIVDAHLDLAMNAIEWNRDLRRPVFEIRQQEEGMTDKLDRGKGVVALPELRKGNMGVVVATQIARVMGPKNELQAWNSPEIAWSITQAQLTWYKEMEKAGEMKQILNIEQLEEQVDLWKDETITNKSKPIGFILSLEGADSLVDISYLERAYGYGLRACGPAHYGAGRYAAGTGATEGFTQAGKELLKEMDQLHMILDITHLTDKGFTEAVESYQGSIWASHHNCRSLVHHQRQLTDDQIKILIERGAVIGGVLDAWMLTNDWKRGVSDAKEKNVTLEKLVDHYDHICQIAGNAEHIAIGTDLDGGYGKEQTPYDIETISDVQHLDATLTKRGYSSEDIKKIFSGNWLKFLKEAWT